MAGTISITVGVPGSGKTTLAQAIYDGAPNSTVLVSRDGLRAELYNGEGILANNLETELSSYQREIVKKTLRADKHVIVHDMNLREKYRKQWAELAWKMGADFKILDLTSVPVSECLHRNQNRLMLGERGVDGDLIRNLHTKFIKPLNGKPVPYPESVQICPVVPEPYIAVPGTPKTIIVDIDGTVADCTNVRSPYDATNYHLDKPKTKVIDLVRELHYDLGYEIVFCSGRLGQFRTSTEEWLYEHVKVPFHLVMREVPGRDDSVEKLYLFNEYIRNYYDVKYVIDDRDRVVDMWRTIGLLTLQPCRGDF